MTYSISISIAGNPGDGSDELESIEDKARTLVDDLKASGHNVTGARFSHDAGYADLNAPKVAGVEDASAGPAAADPGAASAVAHDPNMQATSGVSDVPAPALGTPSPGEATPATETPAPAEPLNPDAPPATAPEVAVSDNTEAPNAVENGTSPAVDEVPAADPNAPASGY